MTPRRCAALTALALLATSVGPAYDRPTSTTALVVLFALVLSAGCALAPASGRRVGTDVTRRVVTWTGWTSVGVLLLSGVLLLGIRVCAVGVSQRHLWLLLPLVTGLLAGLALVVSDSLRGAAGVVMVVSYAVLVVGYVAVSRSPDIDVYVYLRDSTAAFAHGANPWSIDFPNIYSPRVTQRLFGPGLIGPDNRTEFGLPYLPVILLMLMPGHLLGDVRFSAALADVGVVCCLLALARDRVGRASAAVYVGLGQTLAMLYYAWVEPAVVLLLALVVLAARRRPGAVPWVFGVFVVSKQYLAFVAPLLLLMAPRARTPAALRAAVVGCVVVVPFLLWGPAGFVRSVVTLQFSQPFREDSQSPVVWLVNATGFPPPGLLGMLSLALAAAAAALVLWRTERSAAGFAYGVAFIMLVLFTTSKQSFLNYYWVPMAALLLAVAADADPVDPDPDEASVPVDASEGQVVVSGAGATDASKDDVGV